MRNRVIHRNSPFRLLAAALAVLTLTLLAVMVPCEGEAHAAAPHQDRMRWADSLTGRLQNPVAARKATPHIRRGSAASSAVAMTCAFGAAGDTLLRGTGWS